MPRSEISFLPVNMEYYISTIIEYLRIALPNDYQDFLESQRSVVLIEGIAYELSLVAYYINANMLQMFLPTTTTRQSAYFLGKLVNYDLHGASGSSVVLTFSIDSVHPFDIEIPAGTQVQAPGNPSIIFETLVDVVLLSGELAIDVSADQGQTTTEVIGTTSALNLPNQQYSTTQVPLFGTIILVIQSIQWTQVDNIFDLGETDRGYTARPDQNGFAVFTFGNGTFGLIPPPNEQIIVTYRVGGGTNTNVSRNTIVEILSTIFDVNNNVVTLNVTNASAATGGVDSETVEEAKIHIPRSVRSMDRFISQEDFQTIPQAYPGTYGGIFAATAKAKYTWASHIITVFILGNPPVNSLIPTIPSTPLLNDVTLFIQDRTLPTIRINVESAILLPINITATIYYFSNFRQEVVVKNISDSMNFLFDPTRREIGHGFRISDLYGAIDDTDGVDYVDISSPTGDITALTDEFIIPGTFDFTYIKLPKAF